MQTRIDPLKYNPIRLLAAAVAVIAAFSPRLAHGDDQASLNLGLNYYGSTSGSSLAGTKGYFANFLSESGKALIRPNFSAQLEYASGTPTGIGQACTLIAGQLSGGISFFVFKTNQIKPFIGGQATLGWGNMSIGTVSTIGISYGGLILGGAEVRMGRGANSKALRIGTSYRITRAKLGTVTELDAFQLSLGIVF